MSRKLAISDEQVRQAYEKYYIGQRESIQSTAEHIGISESGFRNCCQRLGLRMRTKKESHAAANQPDDESADSQTPLARPKPKTPALKSAPPAEPAPEPEPPAEPAPAPEPDNPARELALTDPGPGRRAIVISSQPYPPAEIVQANGYHSPALSDLAHLVRDLTAAGANVDIRLSIDLEVRP